jgi:hypothetical protein
MSDTSYGTASNISSSPISGTTTSSGSIGSTAALGVGVLGLGSLLAMGPGSLPPEYGQLTAGVPQLQSEAVNLEGQGSALIGQGTQALGMAQAGELTPEQQAQLKVYQSGLTNQARQTYANMGRNPDQDTSFINTTANIDTQVNAMAQAQIQSTIQLGLGEISGGNSLNSTALGFENAANQALIAAGEAQVKLDTSYSSSLTSAFGAIGQMFGAAAKAAPALAVL